MLAALAARMTVRRRGFPSGSPPPTRAATVISLITLVKSRPRLASAAPFLCLIVCHFECPDMNRLLLAIRAAFYHAPPTSKKPAKVPRASQYLSRRCPTLPHRCQRSTIGAEGLNYRV